MINRIQIENFKSIKKMNLELRPINVLIGANGAGKSNFINIFDLLKRIFNKELQNYIMEEAGADNVLYYGLKNSEYLSLEIEFNKKNTYYFLLTPNKEGNLYIHYEGTRFNRENYYGWDDEVLGGTYSESILSENHAERYKYINSYMNSFKVFHFHDTGKSAKIKQFCYLNDNKYLRENGENLAAFLYLLQEKHPKEFNKIEMVIRSVAPYFEKFILQPNRLNTDTIRLEWKEKGSDKYFNALHLSDGTLRFMALVTLLLQPIPPKIIIIDEPELGLHPFAINKLADLIKKASVQTQIILSTQSVNLVDNFTPEDIILVDKLDNQSGFNRPNSEDLKDWLQNYSLSELWNKNVIGAIP